MRKLIYYLNLILTIIAFLIMVLGYLIEHDEDAGILALLALGFYQVLTAAVLTIYLAINNLRLFLGFIIYWLVVVLFFGLLIQYSVQFSFIIALYHLYLCYSVASNQEL